MSIEDTYRMPTTIASRREACSGLSGVTGMNKIYRYIHSVQIKV